MLSPDFVKLAEAHGVAGHRVAARADVLPTLDKVRGSGRPGLVEFRVVKEDAVYPMVPAGSDLHAMIRRPAEAAEGVRS
jgi:acetolactate synthase-1/2/3 large subunit